MIFLFLLKFVLFLASSFSDCCRTSALLGLTTRDSLFAFPIEINFAYCWINDALFLSSKCLITRLHFLIVTEITLKVTSTLQVTEIVPNVLQHSNCSDSLFSISKCRSAILKLDLDVCSSSIDIQALHALTKTLLILIPVNNSFDHELAPSFVHQYVLDLFLILE